LASTITTQEIISTTTFMQVNTSSFKEFMQKLIGASNLDSEKFPITMAFMQVVARVSVGYVETTCTHKQHDNTFEGLFPKPLNDLFTSLPLSFMKEYILLMFGNRR
jgi:hypothetical protein